MIKPSTLKTKIKHIIFNVVLKPYIEKKQKKSNELILLAADMFKVNNLSEAIVLTKRAYKILPTAEIAWWLGFYLEQSGNSKKAIPYLLRAAKNPSQGMIPHQRLGICYRNLGLFDKALPHLLRAYEFNTQDSTNKLLILDTIINSSNCQISPNKFIDQASIVPLQALKNLKRNNIIHQEQTHTYQINNVVDLSGKKISLPTGTYQTGETYSILTENTLVCGGSDIYFQNNNGTLNAYLHLLDYPEVNDVDLTYSSNVQGSSTKALITNLPNIHRKLDGPAIVMLSATSNAYGHWLFEHLPKLSKIIDCADYFGCELLIDEGLHPNHLELLHRLTKNKYKIIEVKNGEQIELKKAILLSANCYMPTKLRPYHTTQLTDGPLPPSVVQFLMKNLSMVSKKRGRKIYLGRQTSSWRKILNEKELIQMLQKFGFEFPDLTVMSISEMLELMSECDIIIGPIGSAMNNIIFSQTGTKIIFLSPQHFGNYQSAFSTYSECGFDCKVLTGKSDSPKNEKHSHFTIDLNRLNKYLLSIIEKSKNEKTN